MNIINFKLRSTQVCHAVTTPVSRCYDTSVTSYDTTLTLSKPVSLGYDTSHATRLRHHCHAITTHSRDAITTPVPRGYDTSHVTRLRHQCHSVTTPLTLLRHQRHAVTIPLTLRHQRHAVTTPLTRQQLINNNTIPPSFLSPL